MKDYGYNGDRPASVAGLADMIEASRLAQAVLDRRARWIDSRDAGLVSAGVNARDLCELRAWAEEANERLQGEPIHSVWPWDECDVEGQALDYDMVIWIR